MGGKQVLAREPTSEGRAVTHNSAMLIQGSVGPAPDGFGSRPPGRGLAVVGGVKGVWLPTSCNARTSPRMSRWPFSNAECNPCAV
jgi:hypothetical protein